MLKQKDFIIKLPSHITMSEECIKIHGITNEKSRECGTNIKNIIEEFVKDVYSTNMLVAHNLDFDLNILFAEIMRLNEPCHEQFIGDLLKKKNLFCTMKESTKLCNIKVVTKTGREYVKFPKLSELHEHLFQSTPKNLHNSLNDVLVCTRCFYKIIYDTDILEKNCELKKLFSDLLE
jgi:DNA polymerase III epsilon subunit-like protein